jgi:hypothetical protein
MKSRFTIILIGLFLPALVLSQSVKSIRINEIQVHNTDGFRDEYGRANSWIELYNAGYNKVNLAGCILRVKEKEYRIPGGDPATIIATRGYMVFFAGGTPDKGTFYTNFTLENTDFVEFCDSDGNVVNRFDFDPAVMVGNKSYGWFEDLDGMEKVMQLPATTPGSNNNTILKEHRSELFKRHDPTGLVLTLICIVFVTLTLTLLYFIFKYMGNYYIKIAGKKSKKATAASVSSGAMRDTTGKKEVITNDELVAVAVALYKYSERLHDAENMVLTINKASKVYSPWSSKIYGLRQYPVKK